MASNSFGTIFRFTSWGESHGPAIGVVIDGCPPGLSLTPEILQPFLDRRRPGQSHLTTQRREADQVQILSGVFEGVTTGTPISLLIENADTRSKDYAAIKDIYRPGHADYTYQVKYGVRDYRGGGRSSARETACRVAAGGVAMQVIRHFLGAAPQIRGAMVQMGPRQINRAAWDWACIETNPFFCPDAKAAKDFETDLEALRKQGLSVGAVIEVIASGFPAGLGDPLYDKLDANLAGALMSINAVKGVEIGDGFGLAALTGDKAADAMRNGPDGAPTFLTNHAGGILGGISNGQDIVARLAVKPTPSMLHPMPSVTTDGQEVNVSTQGRHDPCVGMRAVPVAEAMVACVLADCLLRANALTRKPTIK